MQMTLNGATAGAACFTDSAAGVSGIGVDGAGAVAATCGTGGAGIGDSGTEASARAAADSAANGSSAPFLASQTSTPICRRRACFAALVPATSLMPIIVHLAPAKNVARTMKYLTDDTRITGMEEVVAPNDLLSEIAISDQVSELVFSGHKAYGPPGIPYGYAAPPWPPYGKGVPPGVP